MHSFYCLEKQHQLIDQEQKFVDFVLGDTFPYFLMGTTGGENLFAFSHLFMNRHPSRTNMTGVVNSIYYQNVFDLFNRFCSENKIQYSNVLRAAVNITTATNVLHGDIHIDHAFPHYNFIMYLNDFSDGHTYLFDDGNNITKKIDPSKHKVLVFDGQKHAQGFCRAGEKRAILVVTFS